MYPVKPSPHIALIYLDFHYTGFEQFKAHIWDIVKDAQHCYLFFKSPGPLGSISISRVKDYISGREKQKITFVEVGHPSQVTSYCSVYLKNAHQDIHVPIKGYFFTGWRDYIRFQAYFRLRMKADVVLQQTHWIKRSHSIKRYLQAFSISDVLRNVTLGIVPPLASFALLSLFASQITLDAFFIYLIFFVSVALGSVRWGFSGGLTSLVMSAFIMLLFFIRPAATLGTLTRGDFVRLFDFTVFSLFIVMAIHYARSFYHRAIHQTRGLASLSNATYLLYRNYNVGKKLSDPGFAQDISLQLDERIEFQPKKARDQFSLQYFEAKDDVKNLSEPVIFKGVHVGDLAMLSVDHQDELSYRMVVLPLLALYFKAALDGYEYKQQMQRKAVATERETLRKSIMSSVSHDLKTPLAVIIGSLDVIRNLGQSLDKAKQDTLLGNALDEAERLKRMINNMVYFSKLENHHIDLAAEPINLSDFIQSVIQKAKAAFPHVDITFDDVPDFVEINADWQVLDVAIEKLIENVSVHNKQEHAKMTVDLSVDDQQAVLSFFDNGEQVDLDTVQAVLDPFGRFDKQDTVRSGSGLGLRIVQKIVQMHDGQLFVGYNPDNNAGLAIRLTFPRIREGQRKTA